MSLINCNITFLSLYLAEEEDGLIEREENVRKMKKRDSADE
jgi:hypothetical protein